MERSFEDLLTGLDDESDPELEDIIPDDIDNTNLEVGVNIDRKMIFYFN